SCPLDRLKRGSAPLAPSPISRPALTVWSKKFVYAAARQIPSDPLISFVRLDGIATHSTARADSNKRSAAKLLTKDEAWRIAANVVKLLASAVRRRLAPAPVAPVPVVAHWVTRNGACNRHGSMTREQRSDQNHRQRYKHLSSVCRALPWPRPN